ncbi:hypothetical protein [Streptomyces xiaopingdaonensis]|uniref:hypothetical protein n=1 Tax=Streptomyces xiaopingdaonensis TaxID=1565415 RepID=UPI000377BCF6|nr:hypothetical protein [Streptomyces xiaopingdaonensis]
MSKPTEMMYRALTRLQHGRDGERGASAIEYVGIVIIVGAIILGIRALGLDAVISTAIGNAVAKVVGGG